MARATTKSDLLLAADNGVKSLWELIDSMSEDEQNAAFLFEDRDKNLRDILVHLHEWHNMMKNWYGVGVSEGGTPIVPREGYTWRTISEMNMKIWKEWQNTDLDTAKRLLRETHKKICEIINAY